MKITGTLIKNYYHCRRQAWLYYYGVNFYSDLTRIGKLKHIEEGSDEIVFDQIKLDKITDSEVIEFKKTSSNIDGSKFQLLFYLYLLKQKGIIRKGRLKDLTFHDEYIIELTEEKVERVENLIKEIQDFLNGSFPERKKRKKDCRQCSFFDYCWV